MCQWCLSENGIIYANRLFYSSVKYSLDLNGKQVWGDPVMLVSMIIWKN